MFKARVATVLLLPLLTATGLNSISQGAEARPFPQAGSVPCYGLKPNDRTQQAMNRAVLKCYNRWTSRFMMESVKVPGDYKVNFDNTGATVSEAMGYGMLLTVMMAGADPKAKTYFDGLNRFRKRYPSKKNKALMDWKVERVEEEPNDGCATDGDVDMAMALLMASVQWNNPAYLAEATTIINAIELSLVRADFSLRLGDWNLADGQTRPSDFATAQYRSFHQATGNFLWKNVETKCYSILTQLQADYAPSTGLAPDFTVISEGKWVPAAPRFLEGPEDGNYFYNSCRVPWRIGLSAVYHNEAAARNLMTKFMKWVVANHTAPEKFRAGYALDGSNVNGNGYESGCFIAPTGIAAMVTSNQTWLNQTFSWCITNSDGYYEDGVALMSLLVMSGNAWLYDGTK